MPIKITRRALLRTLFLAGLLVSSALAQSNARLWGIVTDSSGAVLADADVSVHNQATGTEYTAKTNTSGIYQLAALPVGTYKVELRAPGMQTRTISNLVLDVGESVRRDVSLTVGSTTTTVEVSGAAPVIDTSTIEVGQVIDSKTTQEIPLNGRHFVDLSLLTPGTCHPTGKRFSNRSPARPGIVLVRHGGTT
jgi:hypothetical protein